MPEPMPALVHSWSESKKRYRLISKQALSYSVRRTVYLIETAIPDNLGGDRWDPVGTWSDDKDQVTVLGDLVKALAREIEILQKQSAVPAPAIIPPGLRY